MKRYLIEPEFVASTATAADTAPPVPAYKLVYRIIDTDTQQTVPPQGDDIGAIAQACANLNQDQGVPAQLGGGQLPDDIAQAIAISNAKSIGEQPAILANLELSQQIFNQNLRQQNAVAQQQAMNLIRLAVVAKCVAMIENAEGSDQAAIETMGRRAEKLFQDMERSIDRHDGDATSA